MSVGMNIERLDRIAEIEATHFWFTARRRIVHDALRRLSLPAAPVVVDVGCGTGSFVRSLPSTWHRLGLDPHGDHLGAPAPDGPGFVRGGATRLPLRSRSVDLVLALDVLEHVDDRAALAEIARVLRPDGVLVLTVPAGPRLWSRRDDDAGHLRRYTRATLRAALTDGGFAIDRCSAFHGALLPLLAASRVAGTRSSAPRDLEDRPPAAVNRVLSTITGFESALAERGLRPPVGSSLIAIARPT